LLRNKAAFRGWRSAWRAGLVFIEQYVPEWTPGMRMYVCIPIRIPKP
jgi:hypothetical protein